MLIRVTRDDIFTPTWRGNDKLKEEDQIKVSFGYMTAEQEEKFSTMKSAYKGDLNDKDREVKIEIETHANQIWDACVKKVTGLVDEATKKPIDNVKAIRAIPGIYGLITEVVAHIKAGIEALDEKN